MYPALFRFLRACRRARAGLASLYHIALTHLNPGARAAAKRSATLPGQKRRGPTEKASGRE